MISSKGISAASFAVAMGFGNSVQAAVVVVDWLNLATGATASAITLNTDGGLPAALGALAIESGKGNSFPGFPLTSSIGTGFWLAPTGFQDSVAGDDRVGTFDIRVAPQGGMASYALTLDVPADRELIIAVGGLSSTSLGATRAVIVSASGGGVVSFVQSLAWDNGGTAFDQELEWDELTGSLSTTVGALGESEIAFLRLSANAGPDRKLTFLVPEGYGSGSGDSISIGIGMVVPEPGLLALSAVGAIFFLAGRRR